MIRLRHKALIHGFRLFDQLLLIATLGVIVFWDFWEAGSDGDLYRVFQNSYQAKDALGLLVLGVGWIWAFSTFVRYNANRFIGLLAQTIDVAKATTAAAFLLLLVSAACDFSRIGNGSIVVFWLIVTALAVLSRVLLRGFLTMLRRSGRNYRFLLVVGWGGRARNLVERIEASPELGYKIVGAVDSGSGDEAPANDEFMPGVPRLGPLSNLKALLEKGPVDEMVVCLPLRDSLADIYEIVRLGQDLNVVVRFFPEASDAKLLTKFHVELFEGEYVVTFFRENLILQLMLKQMLDIVVSVTLVAVLSPLLLAVALAVKLTSRGPVFFVQERVGMNKRLFKLYKFRSMVVDAEARKTELAAANEMDGPVFKIKDDPRITPVGRFLRRTSIDELPQLLNVLKGDMTLVGPRPPLPTEVDQYEWFYRKRLSIKPGLTCLWQISGRNNISFQEWMELDRQYVDNWSLWLDIKILFKTIPVVLLGKGAS